MMETNKIYHGNCLEVLKTFEDNVIDSCVTDPPYGISFMNKHWDYELPSVEVFKEILRVLKPGAFILCACGTRTQHRMAVNIEDAGFEIRDIITWHYGSGFPKSLDISKAIDKKFGAERTKVIGSRNLNSYATKEHGNSMNDGIREDFEEVNKIYAAVTDEAKQYEGWGTALKPATEFWTLARKLLSEKTVAENVLKYGTGGINIDGSRIETDDDNRRNAKGGDNGLNGTDTFKIRERFAEDQTQQGRFPANVIFDEFTGKILDGQSGNSFSSGGTGEASKVSNGTINWKPSNTGGFFDEGGASRFFYCPKADNFERNKGLDKSQAKRIEGRDEGQDIRNVPYKLRPASRTNTHPTVKPIDLMRYLVKMITPKRGIVLDPFMGSGTTGIGAKLELINYIGIEREEEYCKIAEARIAAWNPEKYLPQTMF